MALLPVLLSPSFPPSPETSPTLGFPSPFVWTTSSLWSPCSPPAPWTFQRHRGPLGTRAGDAQPQAPSAPPCPLPVHPSTLPWIGPCLSSWAMLQSPPCFPVICHLLQCLHWVFQSDPDPPTSGKFVCAFGQQTCRSAPCRVVLRGTNMSVAWSPGGPAYGHTAAGTPHLHADPSSLRMSVCVCFGLSQREGLCVSPHQVV